MRRVIPLLVVIPVLIACLVVFGLRLTLYIAVLLFIVVGAVTSLWKPINLSWTSRAVTGLLLFVFLLAICLIWMLYVILLR